MGQCGCGDFKASWKLQGPGNTLYAIEIYNGCRDCETPVGLVVYRMTRKGDEFFYDETAKLPELPMRAYGSDKNGDAQSAIRVLDPRVLREHLSKWAKGVADEYDVEGAMHDGVEECLRPALYESQGKKP